ncbi:MAG TPA: hypothetical protein VGK46_01560 [Saprospiraceae bacterium]
MATKRSVKKKLLWLTLLVILLLTTCLLFVYINLNRLLTNALQNGFNQNLISNVYAFKFENLDVNILTGSVKVFNVEMYPRKEPVQSYPYINSSFRLGARKMLLKNVNLVKLLRFNKLELKQIELIEPGIEFTIADVKPVFFPFTESTSIKKETTGKIAIESYVLEEFKMVDAHFQVANSAKRRSFNIQRINLVLKDMHINRHSGRDMITYRSFNFSVGEMEGKLEDKALRYVHFKDFKVSIDSLLVEDSPDTVIYHFADVNSEISNLDLQTADSIFHVTMESFNLSYKKKSLEFNNLSFKPNISDAAMQARYKFRKEHFAGNIGSIKIEGIHFDSLIYKRKLWIEEIGLHEVSVSIYKDLRKPFPPDHRPAYLGQQIAAIPIPLYIRNVKATHVNLVNREVTPEGGLGKANINRTTLNVGNITNLDSTGMLTITADAFVENKAHAYLQMNFPYDSPKFSITGKINKFDLTDLNDLTNSYAPAFIKKGIADEITFSGTIYETYSKGTMKFLYHDLVVDLELADKAKWKSTILGFAANTYLNSANPPSANVPPRVVDFYVPRDMRKGFLRMLIKSVLDGVKETFIMDKENRKAYKDVKKEAKQDQKKKNKETQKK